MSVLWSFHCFALRNSSTHHFSKVAAVAIELTEWAAFEVSVVRVFFFFFLRRND